MKYKVGDHVRIKSLDWYNENKGEFGQVECGQWNFTKWYTPYCGKVMTIRFIWEDDECYKMVNSDHHWTDEMIEGLAQEYPKIAIQGDPTRGVSVIDALIALGGENDKDSIATTKHACYFIDHEGKIRSRLLENLPEGFKLYTLEEWRKENMEKENADKKELLLGLVETQKGQELIPHKDYEIMQDGEKFYLVKKKKEYPKTYEECYKVLGYYDRETYCIFHTGADERLFEALYRLKVCRDAYWKIAGEEKGLGKPWKPDFDNLSTNIEYIKIGKGCFTYSSRAFAFPTDKMRDAFYEHFKDLIEECKELL